MSHLHVPDGILPVWLWLSGILLALAASSLSLYMVRGMDLKKKIPLLGMMSAMMLVGMSLEIVPIAYHVNLSVITGIILGPWLSVIAAFMVNILMAMAGHGGITVVGLNTLVVGAEGVVGWALFRVARKLFKPGLAAGLSTLVTLFMSTCMMLSIVFIANVDFASAGAHGLREVIESPTFTKVMGVAKLNEGFNFRLFAYAAFGLGSLGWSIEALVTGMAVKFINKVKPDMVR